MRRVPTAVILLAATCALWSCAAPSLAPSKPGFEVFFAERSAAIEPEARDAIAAAAQRAAATGAAVTVVGWTDSAGSPQADISLSQARARHVADALVANGVPPAHITQRGRGQTGDDPGVASRRVDIELAD